MNEPSSSDLEGMILTSPPQTTLFSWYDYYRVKKNGASVGPGLFWVNPFIDEVKVVDLRLRAVM